jgi:hypothetical protein
LGDLFLFARVRAASGGKKILVFYMDSTGERQFFDPTLKSLLPRSDLICFIAHEGLEINGVRDSYDGLGRVLWVDALILRLGIVKKNITLFLNTEFQPLPGVFGICLFHGQSAKGVTFPYYKLWERFDAFFMYGPLHRESYESEVVKHLGEVPAKPAVYEIGYPKSDDLINGKYSRDDFLRNMGLDAGRKTVIYAPAFNEGASLRCFGTEIIERLCDMPVNVLAKLPIDCLQPLGDEYATGGVNWFERLAHYQGKYKNFRLVRDMKIDAALAASDIMVTCISSVGMEFLAIGRPVIFFNAPGYFSGYLKRLLPNADVEELSRKNYVNGGHEWGLVIDTPDELPRAVSEVIEHPELYPKDPEKLRSYLLYNPGRATDAAAGAILNILEGL